MLFVGVINHKDGFGASVTSMGDLNKDGITDLAVGAPGDDDGGTDRGAVWILFLDETGKVKEYQKISDTEGNFQGEFFELMNFGWSSTSISDLNKDGITDLAVGTNHNEKRQDYAKMENVWILFLDETGKVKEYQKISDAEGNFQGELSELDDFSYSLSGVIKDESAMDFLLIGANRASDGGKEKGAVWILFLDETGKVKEYQKISDTEGNFQGELSENDNFGSAVTYIDLNKDGVREIVVGSFLDDDGVNDSGAIYILFLNKGHTVEKFQKISNEQGLFFGIIDESDYFGRSLTSVGDLNKDGITDLAVGSHTDDDGGIRKGAVWILFLDETGKVKEYQKISDTEGNFQGELNKLDLFGASVTSIGDLNKDGITDLAVGAPGDDDGGTDRGAVWILFLDETGKVKEYQKISDTDFDPKDTLLMFLEELKKIIFRIFN